MQACRGFPLQLETFIHTVLKAISLRVYYGDAINMASDTVKYFLLVSIKTVVFSEPCKIFTASVRENSWLSLGLSSRLN